MTTTLVIAKEPRPGFSKTRLCPPLVPDEAAALAAAALHDTLAAVAASGASRRVLALDGEPGPWLPSGFEVIPQRGEGLAERLAAAFADVGGPAFLVGMDTPQLTPALVDGGLAAVTDAVAAPTRSAVIGPAHDGGYWAIGLPRPDDDVFSGVPMSTSQTGPAQRRRLHEMGYEVRELPCLRDVDFIEDALAVADAAPTTRFATALSALRRSGRVLTPVGDGEQP